MAQVFRSPRSRNVGASLVQVGSYVVPGSGTAVLTAVTVANKLGYQITISLYVRDSGGNDTAIVMSAPIPSGGALAIQPKIVLESGDRIFAVASAASAADIILSMLETTP